MLTKAHSQERHIIKVLASPSSCLVFLFLGAVFKKKKKTGGKKPFKVQFFFPNWYREQAAGIMDFPAPAVETMGLLPTFPVNFRTWVFLLYPSQIFSGQVSVLMDVIFGFLISIIIIVWCQVHLSWRNILSSAIGGCGGDCDCHLHGQLPKGH